MGKRIRVLCRRMILLVIICAGTTLPAEELGGDFLLTDHNGNPFELKQLNGRLAILFFGYTHCPDICPTELANLAAVLDGLGDQAQSMQALFVSLDPKRDTPDVLRNYVKYFSEDLIGLTGSEEEIAEVANRYRVNYQKHVKKDGGYSIDHSANLYLLDSRGGLAAIVPYGLPPEHVLRVVRDLLTREVEANVEQAKNIRRAEW